MMYIYIYIYMPIYTRLNVAKNMSDVKLFLLCSNTRNHLILCEQMINNKQNYLCQIKIHEPIIQCANKMSPGSFKNIIYKQYIYIWYIYIYIYILLEFVRNARYQCVNTRLRKKNNAMTWGEIIWILGHSIAFNWQNSLDADCLLDRWVGILVCVYTGLLNMLLVRYLG